MAKKILVDFSSLAKYISDVHIDRGHEVIKDVTVQDFTDALEKISKRMHEDWVVEGIIPEMTEKQLAKFKELIKK